MMITEKQVEHVIIPMPHEHFVILAPNITIIVLTAVLIVFYIRQSANIRRRIADIQYHLDDIHSTSSLPNVNLNLYPKSSPHRTKSLISFQQSTFSQSLKDFQPLKRLISHEQDL